VTAAGLPLPCGGPGCYDPGYRSGDLLQWDREATAERAAGAGARSGDPAALLDALDGDGAPAEQPGEGAAGLGVGGGARSGS
jgi:hypothetical protein